MAKTMITLDEAQMGKLEQIILDQDTNGALSLLKEIHKKIKSDGITCDPIAQKMRERLDNVIDRSKK